MPNQQNFIKDTRGDALVVEAVILFPIIIMIFLAFVLLAMYLPQRALLQEATQVAATAIATDRSDTWVEIDPATGATSPRSSENRPYNVYVTTFRSLFFNRANVEGRAEVIVRNIASRGILRAPGQINVEANVTNFIIYQELTITAKQEIPMPINLSFIGFPTHLPIEAQATAVVLDGAEFVRNVDLAVDFGKWLDDRLGGTLSEAMGHVGNIASTIFGF